MKNVRVLLSFQLIRDYRDESEFRIIFSSKDTELAFKHIRIDLGSIKRIRLSPWLSKHVAKTVIDCLKTIPECNRLKIDKTSLIDNEAWKSSANIDIGINNDN